jgi:hypothetical protein
VAYAPVAPPSTKRAALIIGIAVGLVVLLGAGIAAYLVLRPDDSPRAALDNWWEAVNDRDVERVRSLTCARFSDDIEEPGPDDAPTTATWDITSVEQIDERTAVVTFTVQMSTGGATEEERWAVVREGGSWKVCGPAEELN